MIRINKFYIVVLGVSLYFALSYGGIFPFYIFYSLLFIFMFTSCYIKIISLYLKLEVVIKKKILYCGETLACTTIVQCAAEIPIPYIEIKSSVFDIAHTEYKGQFINLNSQESQWLRNNIKFNTRGNYNMGDINLKITDILRVVELNKKIDTKDYVKVYPMIYKINNFTTGGKDIYREIQDIRGNNEDQFSIKDVRKYRQGDSLKKIHWKLSAKYGELYVKNSENISGEEVVVFVDLNQDNYIYDDFGIIEEKVVEMALSIINLMLIKEIDVEVFVNSKLPEKYTVSSKEDFQNLLDYFVNEKSNSEVKFTQFIQENYYKVHRVNKLLMVTSKLSEDFIENIIRIMNSGYSVAVYYSLEEIEGENSVAKLKMLGIQCFSFSELVNLKLEVI